MPKDFLAGAKPKYDVVVIGSGLAGMTAANILGRAGRRLVVHLSQSWGGLQTRNPLLDNIFHWPISIPPKLELPAT